MSGIRIIGGKWKRKKLLLPPSSITRPTMDRVRESLFNILNHHLKSFHEKTILDAFAGSGAFGLEALSWGASFCTFAEKNLLIQNVLKKNISHCEAWAQSKIYNDIFTLPFTQTSVDVVFLDPPYQMQEEEKVIKNLINKNWVNSQTLICVESDAKLNFNFSDDFLCLDRRKYGKCELSFWEFQKK